MIRKIFRLNIKCKAAIAVGEGSFLIDDDITVDDPGSDEVLVKIKATGLCHTDYDSLALGNFGGSIRLWICRFECNPENKISRILTNYCCQYQSIQAARTQKIGAIHIILAQSEDKRLMKVAMEVRSLSVRYTFDHDQKRGYSLALALFERIGLEEWRKRLSLMIIEFAGLHNISITGLEAEQLED